VGQSAISTKISFTGRYGRSIVITAMVLMLPFSASYAQVLLDRIVAVVNDDIVLRSELTQGIEQVRARYAAGNASLPPENRLTAQVLEQLIISKIQAQQSRAAGIKVTEEQLNEAIANMARRGGMTPDQFVASVRAQGMSFEKFRTELRDEIAVQQFRQREIQRRIVITDREVDSLLEQMDVGENNEYRIEHILVPVSENASAVDRAKLENLAESLRQQLSTGASIQAVMAQGQSENVSGGDLGWRMADTLPGLFAEAVKTMTPGQSSSLLRSPSGYHAFRLVDQRGGDSVFEETHARHILLRSTSQTEAGLNKQLADLRQRILSGEDFAKLATEFSQDGGSAEQGGDLGWVPPGATVEPFERAMASLKAGEISQPFKTDFGWHIVQVIDRRSQNVSGLAMRNQAREALFRKKMSEETDNWLRRLRNEAFVEIRLDAPPPGL